MLVNSLNSVAVTGFTAQKKNGFLYRSKLGYLLIFVIFFIFLYPVQFKGTPVTNRVLAGFLSITILSAIAVFRVALKKFYIKKQFLKIAGTLLLISVVSFFSIKINGSGQTEFLLYPLRTPMIILAVAYWCCLLIIQVYGYISFTIITRFFIITVTIQSIIALLNYSVPAVNDFFNSIQDYNELDNVIVNLSAGARVMGFGAKFMNAGVIVGFCLILIGVILKTKKLSYWQNLGLVIVFILNFIVGMMMARTTIIGAVLSLAYVIFPTSAKKFSLKNKLRFASTLIVLGICFYIFVIPLVSEEITQMFNYGFEMFVNYSTEGELRTESSDMVMNMWIWPDNFKTWIIGDALFSTPDGLAYYKSTDIGYCRLIFYFGLIGFISFTVYQLGLMYWAFKAEAKKIHFKLLMLIIAIFYFTIMSKGIMEMTYLTGMFWMASNIFRKKYNLS